MASRPVQANSNEMRNRGRQPRFLEAALGFVCIVAMVFVVIESYADLGMDFRTLSNNDDATASLFVTPTQTIPTPSEGGRRSARRSSSSAKQVRGGGEHSVAAAQTAGGASARHRQSTNYVPPPPPHNVPTVLILTPVKDLTTRHSLRYIEHVRNLTYPHAAISIALLESDSKPELHGVPDDMGTALLAMGEWASVQIIHHDFKYELDRDSAIRHAANVQERRRAILAKSRNQLLMRAIGAHE
jgi:hypothetical protein